MLNRIISVVFSIVLMASQAYGSFQILNEGIEMSFKNFSNTHQIPYTGFNIRFRLIAASAKPAETSVLDYLNEHQFFIERSFLDEPGSLSRAATIFGMKEPTSDFILIMTVDTNMIVEDKRQKVMPFFLHFKIAKELFTHQTLVVKLKKLNIDADNKVTVDVTFSDRSMDIEPTRTRYEYVSS